MAQDASESFQLCPGCPGDVSKHPVHIQNDLRTCAISVMPEVKCNHEMWLLEIAWMLSV